MSTITEVTFGRGRHKHVIGYFIHRGALTWYWTVSVEAAERWRASMGLG